MKLFLNIGLCLSICCFIACNSPYTPKPKSFPIIHFPEKEYTRFESDYCPMSFDVPLYAVVDRDSMYFNESAENPCWLNIQIPSFNATLHLSYKPLSERYSLDQLREQAYQLSIKHIQKAAYIEPKALVTPENVIGIWYDLGGNSASNAQFYITDSSKHFIRAALYIKERPNVDSLQPVIEFLKADIEHLVKSLKWRE